MPDLFPNYGPHSNPLAGAPLGWVAPLPGFPVTPAAYLANLLDGQTGEWNSLTDGLHPIDAIVRFQVQVTRGTGAAVLEDGNRFVDIQYNSDTAAAAFTHELHRILDPLVAAGWISIEVMQVQAGEDQGDLAAGFVSYKNLLLSKEEARKIEF